MPEAITFFSFLIPTRTAAFIVLCFLALFLIRVFSHLFRTDALYASRITERSLWIGIVSARIGYGLSNWQFFRSEPWTLLFLWQPGYSVKAGIVGASLYLLYQFSKLETGQKLRYTTAILSGLGIPAIIFIGVLLTMNRFTADDQLKPGDVVPDFTVIGTNGQSMRLSSLGDKGLVLNFWATWCPPCRREAPVLEDIYRQNQGSIKIVGVAMDDHPNAVQAFIKSTGISYPNVLDNVNEKRGTTAAESLFSRFGVVGLPTTVFINSSRKIVSIHVGELNRAALAQRIDQLQTEQ